MKTVTRLVRKGGSGLFLLAVLTCLILFGVNTLTNRGDFSDPDTMNFVDVARNILAGRGITQSAAGYNAPRFTDETPIPMPLTSQPPAEPLLIALIALSGLSVSLSAVLLSWISYGLILLLAYQVACKLYDRQTAVLTTASLLLYAPLKTAAEAAFSEPAGLVFLLLTLLTLVHLRCGTGRNTAAFSMLAGLCAGLAFASRYALLPLSAVAALFVLLEARQKKSAFLLYSLGVALPVGAVLIHNKVVSGLLMPRPNPSAIGLRCNISQTLKVLFRESMDFIPATWQPVFLGILLAALLIILLKQRRLIRTSIEVFFRNGRYILTLFFFGYLSFLIIQRTRIHFDYINWRMVIPAGLMACLLLSAFIVRTLRPKRLTGILTVVVLLLAGREALALIRSPDPVRMPARQERLAWVRENTSVSDLIVGVNTVDIPFYLFRPAAVSFSRYPYSDYLTYERMMDFCAKWSATYERIYLILPDEHETDFEERYGAFITDLVKNRKTYPAVFPVERLTGGETVYELRVP